MIIRMLKLTTVLFVLMALFVTVDDSGSEFGSEIDGVVTYVNEKCGDPAVPKRELKNPNKDKTCWEYGKTECVGKKPKFKVVKSKGGIDAPADNYYYYTCEISQDTIEYGTATCAWDKQLESCFPKKWSKRRILILVLIIGVISKPDK